MAAGRKFIDLKCLSASALGVLKSLFPLDEDALACEHIPFDDLILDVILGGAIFIADCDALVAVREFLGDDRLGVNFSLVMVGVYFFFLCLQPLEDDFIGPRDVVEDVLGDGFVYLMKELLEEFERFEFEYEKGVLVFMARILDGIL